jgi:hypothetical protein
MGQEVPDQLDCSGDRAFSRQILALYPLVEALDIDQAGQRLVIDRRI